MLLVRISTFEICDTLLPRILKIFVFRFHDFEFCWKRPTFHKAKNNLGVFQSNRNLKFQIKVKKRNFLILCRVAIDSANPKPLLNFRKCFFQKNQKTAFQPFQKVNLFDASVEIRTSEICCAAIAMSLNLVFKQNLWIKPLKYLSYFWFEKKIILARFNFKSHLFWAQNENYESPLFRSRCVCDRWESCESNRGRWDSSRSWLFFKIKRFPTLFL